MNKKVIIVGGVAGGASCAARLRRHTEEFEILLLERGSNVSFANCGLPYFVGGIIKEESSLYLASTETFRNRFNVDARTNAEVTKVDRHNKKVTIMNRLTGHSYQEAYDFLVLSPGSKPLRPPLPGIDSPGIFSLRDVPDSKRIKEWISQRNVQTVAVIGGGFIGLEMAENLVELGIQTTLIERSNQVMPSVDFEMAAPLEESLERHGVELKFETEVSSFSHQNNQVTINTTEEEQLTVDMVILAIGVAPESDLARDCNLQLGARGHIIVDANLRSSDPSIYAVGDCIEVNHVVSNGDTSLPLAGPANRQGRIAADMLSGRPRHFRGVQGTAVCGLFDQVIASTGLTEKAIKNFPHRSYSVVYAHPIHHVNYYPGAKSISLKLIFDPANGQVLGAQAVGEEGVERRIDVIAMAIQMKATVFDLEESELCYAPQFGAAKDPVNLLGMIGSNAMRGDLPIAHYDQVGTEGTLLLDVRDPDEITARPIPNAINIPLNDLRHRQHELRQYALNNPVILVTCATSARANNAVRLLRNLGHTAYLLPGGEKTWSALNIAQRRKNTWPCASTATAPTQKLEQQPAVAIPKLPTQRKTFSMNSKINLDVLRTVKILRSIPSNNVTAAMQCMKQIAVKSGEPIIQAGKKNDSFFILLKGSAEKKQIGTYENDAPTISQLHEGDHFNDEALVMNGFCEADVTMLTDGIIIYMNRPDFLRTIAAPLVETVDVQEALENSSQDYQVIDVRHDIEIEELPIPGAINIPLSELPQQMKKLDLNQNYLVCCSAGKRSAAATLQLRQHGYQATSLRSGVNNWPLPLSSLGRASETKTA